MSHQIFAVVVSIKHVTSDTHPERTCITQLAYCCKCIGILQQSWLLSINLGWDGGVHVQTCGHHLHLDCLNSYLHSLRLQQRQQNLIPEK